MDSKDENLLYEQLEASVSQSEYWVLDLVERTDLFLEVQLELARDRRGLIRRKLAGNSHLDPEVQLVLAKDASEEVREILAAAYGLAREAQLILAKDASWSVQTTLAGNPGILPEVQEVLVSEGGTYALYQLAGHSDFLPHLQMKTAVQDTQEEGRVSILRRLAQRSDLLPEVQEYIASVGTLRTKALLARCASLCPAAQSILSREASPAVHGALTQNLTLSWDASMGARVVAVADPAFYEKAVAGVESDAKDLLPNWRGSLEGLLEAIFLTK